MKSISNEKNLENKIILLRLDFNVPLKGRKVLSDFRIKAALPTIKFLIKEKAKVVIISHLGRPKGKIVKEMSLEPVAKHLEKLLKKKVSFIDECIGEKVRSEISKMELGQVIVLENLRFHKEEEENNKLFSEKLALMANIFVNDAFSVCHRNHASIVSVPSFIKGYMGLLLEKEIKECNYFLKKPSQPYTVIIGGAKISSKIDTINNLAKRAKYVLVGGALANTFLKAKNIDIGQSLYEEAEINVARKLMLKIHKNLKVPADGVVAVRSKSKFIKKRFTNFEDIKEKEEILDIGPRTAEQYCQFVKISKTIFWAGPMGYFEKKEFSKGSKIIAGCMSKSKAFSGIAGGDTVAFVEKHSHLANFDIVFTGGGATLEYLGGKELPGLRALR